MDRKALSFPILLSMVIGNMVGTGIYVLPATLARFGNYAILAWIFTSIGAMFFALTIAALNKRLPKTGGLYVFCRQAYGRLAGFIVGYLYWISNLVSIAGIAVSSITYLGFLYPVLDSNSASYNHYMTLAIELGIVWLFTLINIVGLHLAGVIQIFLTVIKIIPLLLISLLGLGFIHFDHFTHVPATSSALQSIGSAAALTFWAYIGIESATVPAENTRGWRDIYRATIYGTAIASFIYILSTFVLMGMIPNDTLQHSQFPFADAANIIFGHQSAAIIALCAIISGLGALNVTILVQGQIVFAAARDKLFPAMFSKLSKGDVPVAGQLLSSSLVSVLLFITMQPQLLGQFESIATLAALFTLLAYFGAALAELKFLYQDFGMSTKLLFNKATFIATVAVAYCAWMISVFNYAFLLAAFVSIVLCMLMYAAIFRKQVL